MKDLEAIKKRAERATPGPWTAFEGNEADGVNCADDEQLTWDDHGGEVFKPANAEFIAHARTDIPKLIAALEAVDQGLDGLDAIFDGPSDDDEAIRTISQGLRDAITEALQ